MKLRVGILGAGAIGTFVGVALSSVGVPVILVDRRPLPAPEAFRAADPSGGQILPGSDLVVTTDPAALCEVDLCIVAVKSGDGEAAARTLAGVLAPRVPVVALQNGLHAAERIARHVRPAIPGIVGFNVFTEAPGRVRRAVDGPLLLGSGSDGPTLARIDTLAAALRRAGIDVAVRQDMDAVVAGKLLVNLVNGISGATGLGIPELLADSDARWCWVQCLREGRRVLRRNGRAVARVTIVGPRLLELVLSAPTGIVLRGARSLAAMDPRAKPSTLQDLQEGRPTEIEELNGEIVRLAARSGLPAPCNAVVTAIVRAHERRVAQGRVAKFVPPVQLRRRMRAMIAAPGEIGAYG